MKHVYLCGPITGLSYEEAQKGWREQVAHHLRLIRDVVIVSPMRSKQHLEGAEDLSPLGGPHLLGTPRAIVTRDRYDVRRSVLIFANFIDADRVSIGSVWELGWANAWNIPIICCVEAGSLHDHAFVREMAWTCPTVEQGILAAKALLTEGL